MADNRWFILLVLFAARFSLGFQFQAAGSVTPSLLNDFGSDYTGIGTLVGLFMIPGLVLTVPSGFLGQRYGDKLIVVIGLLMMAIGGTVCGTANDYATLAIGRLLSGAGAAILFVLMTKMLIDWFADKELFLGMSIFIIGWPVGIAAGQAVQPELAITVGWSFVFHLTTLISLIALLAIAFLYQPPNRTEAMRQGGFSMLSREEFILVTIAGLAWMFVNGAYLVMVSFGPVLLDQHGVPFAIASRVTSLMSWVFLFSLPLGGYIATRYGIPKGVMFSGLAGTVVVGAVIPFTDIPFITFTLFGIFYAASAPILGALPAQVLTPENRGPGLGIYYIWYFLGCALLPILGGYLRDLTGTATASVLFAVGLMLATLILAAVFHAARSALQVGIAES